MKAKWNQGKPCWFEGNKLVRPLILQELIEIFGLIPSKYGTKNAYSEDGFKVIQYECYPKEDWYLNSDGVDFWYSNGDFQRYLVLSELRSISKNLDYRKRETKKRKKKC